MKQINTILAAFFIVFSCQNEAINNKNDWTLEIDKAISKYERKAKIELSKSFIDNDIETTIEIYKEDYKGFYKIKVIGYKEHFVNFSQEYYIQNSDIILSKSSGLVPLLYKGQKKETDPCCIMFNRLTYFKNSNEAKAYVKEIKLMTIDGNKEKFEDELKILPLIEDEIMNVQDTYESARQHIKWLKNRIK